VKNKLYAAIDLGGTKIYTVLADSQGAILAAARLPSAAALGPDAVMQQMAVSVGTVLDEAQLNREDVLAVGVCAAGFFDWQEKVMVSSPNLPGFSGVALEKRLSSLLGLKVLAENDANAAALGEARLGAGRGCSEVVYVTVSTGIGAGLIINGRIYRGGRGFAGELGHMVVKPDGPVCGCGRRGCLEAVSSGTAIARAAKEAVNQGAATILKTAADGQLTAPAVFAAASQGDAVALSVLQHAVHYLGMGLVNVVNMFNPEVIVIGGGVAEAGETFLSPLSEIIAARAVPPAASSVALKKAQLGVKAGVAGMICLLAETDG
jgi:glucokinase